MFVGADRNLAVVTASHHVQLLDGPDLDETAPRGVGIGSHARSVEENADRVAIEAVLNEHVVVGGHEEVVPGGDTARAELDAVIQELHLVGQLDKPERFAAEDLLHREDVADVFSGKAGAEPFREGDLERATGEPEQLPEIEHQVDAEVAGPFEAAWVLSADRIPEGIGDESDTRIDAVVLEPRTRAQPVSKQVAAWQNELEGDIGQAARGSGSARGVLGLAGRGSVRGVFGVGGDRPAEDHQNNDSYVMTTPFHY